MAAILNVYFIVSSGIRILTQEILFRRGIVAGPSEPHPWPAGGRRARWWTGPSVCSPRRVHREDRQGRRAEPKTGAGTGKTAAGAKRKKGSNSSRDQGHRAANRRNGSGWRDQWITTARRGIERHGRGQDEAYHQGHRLGQRVERQEAPDRRAARQREPVETTPRAPPMAVTDLRTRPPMTEVRPNPRSIPAPRRSERERPGKQWIGWKQVESPYRRQKRSCWTCWGSPRTTLSSSCSVSPRLVCSVGCGARPGSRPGSVRWPPHRSEAVARSRRPRNGGGTGRWKRPSEGNGGGSARNAGGAVVAPTGPARGPQGARNGPGRRGANRVAGPHLAGGEGGRASSTGIPIAVGHEVAGSPADCEGAGKARFRTKARGE